MFSKIPKSIKYPKLLLLLGAIVFAVGLYASANNNQTFGKYIYSWGYLGILVGGFFYAYGLTAAPATVLLLVLAKTHSLLISGLLGGLGALVGDVIIFYFVRQTFTQEIERLKCEKVLIALRKLLKWGFGSFSKYVLPVVAGINIASPLPTEIGVSILATLKTLSIRKFILLAYVLHTIGIFTVLWIGKNT
jgi:uncharacterized membrane protein YdjX (TVP38/TMEM64 family)